MLRSDNSGELSFHVTPLKPRVEGIKAMGVPQFLTCKRRYSHKHLAVRVAKSTMAISSTSEIDKRELHTLKFLYCLFF